MAEYIDREETKKALGLNFGSVMDAVCANRIVDSIPTADVAPVRHGRWIGIEFDGYADGYPAYDLWECSECKEECRGEDISEIYSFCPYCGAIMDGGEGNAEI